MTRRNDRSSALCLLEFMNVLVDATCAASSRSERLPVETVATGGARRLPSLT